MWLYVLSFVSSCPLRFHHENGVRFVFTSSCLMGDLCVIYFICVYLCIVVSNTYCVVFFFVLCLLCCQFLWIVHFWFHLRYSLTFILKWQNTFQQGIDIFWKTFWNIRWEKFLEDGDIVKSMNTNFKLERNVSAVKYKLHTLTRLIHYILLSRCGHIMIAKLKFVSCVTWSGREVDKWRPFQDKFQEMCFCCVLCIKFFMDGNGDNSLCQSRTD